MNYNTPPWLITKKHFIILSLIIPGMQCVTSDTYLEPLVEELKLLWEVGIHVRDATQFNHETHFNLCAILMWTMHDLLANLMTLQRPLE
jgi:hypothetical protein